MAVRGWRSRYAEILSEFGYSRARDAESARILDSLIRDGGALADAKAMIRGRPVAVVGAGPSLSAAIPHARRAGGVVMAAGSSVGALVRGGVMPDVIVTDLDGDDGPLRRLADRAIFVVHAHGDNAGLLPLASSFRRCIGTAQSGPLGRVRDYGGFTDGDRAVFFARHMGASRIVLLGMDFGRRIGAHSGTRASERATKLKKLERGRRLLEWLATKPGPGLYATSGRIAGFERVSYGDLPALLE